MQGNAIKYKSREFDHTEGGEKKKKKNHLNPLSHELMLESLMDSRADKDK